MDGIAGFAEFPSCPWHAAQASAFCRPALASPPIICAPTCEPIVAPTTKALTRMIAHARRAGALTPPGSHAGRRGPPRPPSWTRRRLLAVGDAVDRARVV